MFFLKKKPIKLKDIRQSVPLKKDNSGTLKLIGNTVSFCFPLSIKAILEITSNLTIQLIQLQLLVLFKF